VIIPVNKINQRVFWLQVPVAVPAARREGDHDEFFSKKPLTWDKKYDKKALFMLCEKNH
jgi:hypothetical protein